ncbi:hypothetical protein CKO_04895 [Citrobacter koseri ATCC BAA-895]|uniref:Uncharacterized protein n=1 Tax=Citrobacter koseri (strain ATCC BAA-895 / CDC 4225-83 / SGSC4696) TaxID=290338 RepID=A8AR27_CITK8|nr:hypothetical protein CKO_04895 [Citrobacter koseri ATCC BAA-895]
MLQWRGIVIGFFSPLRNKAKRRGDNNQANDNNEKKWWFTHHFNPSENAEISIPCPLWCCHLPAPTSTLDNRAVSIPLAKK